jgi:hypothetical protein
MHAMETIAGGERGKQSGNDRRASTKSREKWRRDRKVGTEVGKKPDIYKGQVHSNTQRRSGGQPHQLDQQTRHCPCVGVVWWVCTTNHQNLHHNTSNRAGSACHRASLHRPTARQQQPAKQRQARRKAWWLERQRFASSGPLGVSTCASGDRDMSYIPKMENTRPVATQKQQRRKTGPHA